MENYVLAWRRQRKITPKLHSNAQENKDKYTENYGRLMGWINFKQINKIISEKYIR